MRTGPLIVTGLLLSAFAAGGGWISGQALAGRSGQAPITSMGGSAAPGTPPLPSSTGSSPTASPQQLLEAAKRATVRLSPAEGTYVGSGTVVSPDGLVLTNAHVAAPQAPGLAFHYARQFTEQDPETLTVSVSPPGDVPAVATYRASLVLADGYLDVAVLRINAMADGSPLPPRQRFAFVPIGSVQRLSTGDGVTVLGYPVVGGGGAVLSVTRGDIATFVPDLTRRVKSPRWEIDTSARIAGGNSGGAAINDKGELIGVPSAASTTSEYSGRIRPADLALPLLELARAGQGSGYTSPYDVLGDGHEAGEPVGWAGDGVPCAQSTATTMSAGHTPLQAAVNLSGMTTGEDLMFQLLGGGNQRKPLNVALATWGGPSSAGCVKQTFTASDAGSPDGFRPGSSYALRVFAGPQLRELTTVPLQLID